MKILLILFVFFLPFHALIITFFKCKLWLDWMNFIRFWKEWIILFLLSIASFRALKTHNFSIRKLYKNNYILWLTTAFIICSLLYIYIPFFEFKLSWFLWFKYDTFFLFALIIWLFLPSIKNNLNTILKTIFISTWVILIIFLPWYIFWDISQAANILWYSDKVSTYQANSCISFAQNVNWEHRFQATFGWPIRFSVFLVIFYMIYIWYILTYIKSTTKRYAFIIIPSIFVLTWIFYSYSKTSILWLIFSWILFIYLSRKIIFNKKISKLFIWSTIWISVIPIIILSLTKKTLFLHLWSLLNRADNIWKSIEMFLYNPLGYWLWIAWPASQIWNSMGSTWSWEIATMTVTKTYKFLPENWFIQILLEQWIVWLALFISLIIIIWIKLYRVSKRKKDYISISIFVAFITLVFMSNFTHAFEESATSYLLFLIIWWYLSSSTKH